MIPCFTCGEARQQPDEALRQITIKAKEHGVKENISVAIWQEEGQWCYGNAFDAASGGKPIFDIFSIYRQTTIT